MNKKTVKILALVLSICALIACAIGIGVSAETEEPTLEILSKNMSYGSNFKLAFAVNTDGVAEDQTVEVLLYAEDPATNPDTAVYKAELAKNTKYEGTYPVYFSYGIPAKDLTAYVWAQAHIVGTETYGEVYRYSAVEYFCERLYTETADVTEAQAKLYNTCLTYCADAQAVLATDSPAFGDVNYVYAPDTAAFGNDYSALVGADYVLDLTYPTTAPAGKMVKWEVKYVADDGTVTKETLDDGAKITVSDKHVVAKVVLEDVMIKFDSFDSTKASYTNGILTTPGEGTSTLISNNFTVSQNPVYNGITYYSTDVTASPAPRYDGDLAYKVYTRYTAAGADSVISKGDNYGSLVVPVVGEGNRYTLSYDVYIATDGNTSNGAVYQLNFSTSSSQAVRMTVFGQVVSDGGKAFRMFSSNSKGETSYKTIGGYTNFDEWFNVKVEVFALGAPNYFVAKYYVNGFWVGDDVSYNADTTAALETVRFTSMNANNATVYFDNISYVADNGTYVAGAPDDGMFPVINEGELAKGNGAYFSDANANGARYDFDDVTKYNINSTLKDSGNTGVLVFSGAKYADAYRTPDGGIYYVKTGVGGSGDHTLFRYNTATAPKASDAETKQIVEVIEFDAAFNSTVKNFFVIRALGNGIRSDIYMHADSNTGEIFFGNTAGGTTSPKLAANTIYNFRFEIYNDHAFDTTSKSYSTVKVFINNVEVCTVLGVDYAASSSTNYVSFSLRTGVLEGEYAYFDNIFIGYKEVDK